MNKPREFWITTPVGASTIRGGGFTRYEAYDADMENPPTPIHVIEYSAYEELKSFFKEQAGKFNAEIAELTDKRDRYRKALEEIQKIQNGEPYSSHEIVEKALNNGLDGWGRPIKIADEDKK